MRFNVRNIASGFVLSLVLMSTSAAIFQNCSPVSFATLSQSSQASSTPGCDPATFGSQPYSTSEGSGVCTCTSAGTQTCTLTACTDPAATLTDGICLSPTYVMYLINNATSASVAPGASVNLNVTTSPNITALSSSLSTITRVAGNCANPNLTYAALLSSGSLQIGSQNFTYSPTLASKVGGCTFTMIAATSAKSASVQFQALVCTPGTANTTNPTCTTTDGKAGHSYCEADGLGYECRPDAVASCTFNGTTIASGGTVTGYQTSTVPYGSTCNGQTRTCTNGTLSGTYAYSSCSVQGPASCSFNGTTIADGGTVTTYASSEVPYGSSCVSQVRTCSNGSLSGSYTNTTCSVESAQSCTLNGRTVPNGQSVTTYNTTSVPYGSTCSSITRTCNNGTMSGDSSYLYYSCSVTAPVACSFNGSTISSGGAVTAYQSPSVPYGSSCSAETRTCTNGYLSGSFTNSACSPLAPANCTLNGTTVNNGSSITAYANSSAPYGSSCSSQQRTCNNGSLSGTNQHLSCTVTDPATCSFNGSTVPHNGSVTAYSSSSVAYGSSCSSQTRTCNNGSLSGSFGYGSCAVNAGSFAWTTGSYGSCTNYYQTRSVVCTETTTNTVVADGNCSGAKPSSQLFCGHAGDSCERQGILGQPCSIFSAADLAAAQSTVDYCGCYATNPGGGDYDHTIRCVNGVITPYTLQCWAFGGTCQCR